MAYVVGMEDMRAMTDQTTERLAKLTRSILGDDSIRYSEIGLRAMTPSIDAQHALPRVGDILPPSWHTHESEDGDEEYELDGTAAFALRDGYGRDRIDGAVSEVLRYRKAQRWIAVIGGDLGVFGERAVYEPGETIIRNARVLALIEVID
jgi:hypothetical protein